MGGLRGEGGVCSDLRAVVGGVSWCVATMAVLSMIRCSTGVGCVHGASVDFSSVDAITLHDPPSLSFPCISAAAPP